MITFRPFSKQDWEDFAGCESEQPLIATLGDDFLIIVDGSTLELVEGEEPDRIYRLTLAHDPNENRVTNPTTLLLGEAIASAYEDLYQQHPAGFAFLVDRIFPDPESY
jgi:hypothetical protein